MKCTFQLTSKGVSQALNPQKGMKDTQNVKLNLKADI